MLVKLPRTSAWLASLSTRDVKSGSSSMKETAGRGRTRALCRSLASATGEWWGSYVSAVQKPFVHNGQLRGCASHPGTHPGTQITPPWS